MQMLLMSSGLLIYTNEAHFYIGYSDPKKIYDFSNPKFMEKIKATEAQSVYIWAGFGIWGITDVIFIDGRLNGELYTEVLKFFNIFTIKRNL